MLITAGADLKAQDKARFAVSPFRVPFLVSGGHARCSARTRTRTRMESARGADVRCCAAAQDGRSPLHKACERGCLAVGVMLLENKADVNARDMVRHRQRAMLFVASG